MIFVTNDDGINAPGMHRLVEVLLEIDRDITVVCPETVQSGKSMAITFDTPLRIKRLDDWHGAKMYKVNGTPVDCVKIAMHTILDRKPDLVVSGINHGSNAAVNVVYSGTMGAAFEATACGIPAIGFSLTDHSAGADFTPAIPFVREITSKVMKHGLPAGVCLNVNVPAGCTPSAMRVVKAAKGRWTDEYREYTDPAGGKFYMVCGHFHNDDPDDSGTDEWCLAHGIVSVVPCLLDRTAPGGDFSWIAD